MYKFALLFTVAILSTSCGKSPGDSKINNVFGADDRVAMTTLDYPWRTIGYIADVGCTGTMVAKDLVLTAAHCVIDSNTKKLRNDITNFHPNYINGSSILKSYIQHIWWGTTEPDKFRGDDWAILKLREPIGNSVGWLGVESTTANSFPDLLTVAGYSNNFMNGRTAGVHHNCQTKRRLQEENMIYHDCDMSRGSSGGPALRNKDGKLTIYGINVAEKRNGGETSLYVNSYEDKYANIVIPTHEAAKKLIEIMKQN